MKNPPEEAAMSQTYRTLRVARSGEGVLSVVIDAPPMNLIGPELVRDLVTLVGELESDQDIRVMVLESADPEYFVPHVDLTKVAEYTAEAARAGGPDDASLGMLWHKLSELPVVTIAKIRGDGGADAAGVFDAVALAEVSGPAGAAAAVVADGHPGAAPAADDDALQQRWSFAGRPGGAVAAVGGGVGGQLGEVGVVLVQGDVAGVGAGDEGDPLLAGQDGGGLRAAGPGLVAVPAVGERPGVAGVVQHSQHHMVLQGSPVELAFAGSLLVPAGEGQAGGAERLDDGGGRPGRLEGGEQVG